MNAQVLVCSNSLLRGLVWIKMNGARTKAAMGGGRLPTVSNLRLEPLAGTVPAMIKDAFVPNVSKRYIHLGRLLVRVSFQPGVPEWKVTASFGILK